MRDKISVIIPCYNTCSYLPRCLESWLRQSNTELEIIIVNDGSTDGTEDYLNKLDDERIKIISYKQNKGANYARNKGLRLAEGNYIFMSDSDSYVRTNILEVLLPPSR